MKSHLYPCLHTKATRMVIATTGKYTRPIFPTCVVLFMAYAQWAYSYYFCYSHIYQKSGDKSSMIAFLVITNTLWLILLLSWVLVIILGPGSQDVQVNPYDLDCYASNGYRLTKNTDTVSLLSAERPTYEDSLYLLNPPDIFECDPNGLPFWCSACSSLKLLRSHHSSLTTKCIPFFDHYCSFIGSTIGKRNYGPFMIFVICAEVMLLFTSITVIIYGGIWNSLNAAFIVLVVITGTFAILVGNLLFNQISDLFNGETTLERMHRIRWKKSLRSKTPQNNMGNLTSYVNTIHPYNEKLRIVVALQPDDLPYNKGFIENLNSWFFDISKLKEPDQISHYSYTMFGIKFKKTIRQRIEIGEYKIFGANDGLRG